MVEAGEAPPPKPEPSTETVPASEQRFSPRGLRGFAAAPTATSGDLLRDLRGMPVRPLDSALMQPRR